MTSSGVRQVGWLLLLRSQSLRDVVITGVDPVVQKLLTMQWNRVLLDYPVKPGNDALSLGGVGCAQIFANARKPSATIIDVITMKNA